jgi:hypothetical protein
MYYSNWAMLVTTALKSSGSDNNSMRKRATTHQAFFQLHHQRPHQTPVPAYTPHPTHTHCGYVRVRTKRSGGGAHTNVSARWRRSNKVDSRREMGREVIVYEKERERVCPAPLQWDVLTCAARAWKMAEGLNLVVR